MHSNFFRPAAFLILLAFMTPVLMADPTEFEAGEIIVALNPGHSIDEILSRWEVTLLDAYPDGNLYLVYAEAVEELEDFADMMEDDPAVNWAEANYFQETPEAVRQMVIIAIGGTLVDYEDQEIAQRIGIDDAHLIARGEGVKVAVLDSGVDPDHEALVGHLAPGGYDFLDDDSEPWEEANGLDDDDDGLADEGYGHGTMVAGVVALVAPEAEILPLRVLDDEGRSDAFLISKAISYALNDGANILNMSFGVPFEIESIGHQIDLARSLGTFVIAGAGNENREDPAYFPAIEDEAFMVTALDSLDRKADFADWNDHVLVSAPGTGVRSAFPDEQWGLGSGCSFATPFITGEAALILSVWPDLELEEVEERIESAIDPIYHIPENEAYDGELGSGRVYLPLAVGGASSGASELPTAVRVGLTAFPNPSHGTLRLEIPWAPEDGSSFDISVFTASGRLVHTHTGRAPSISWDGRDHSGQPVRSGVYYILLRGEGRSERTSIRILR